MLQCNQQEKYYHFETTFSSWFVLTSKAKTLFSHMVEVEPSRKKWEVAFIVVLAVKRGGEASFNDSKREGAFFLDI
jgi:hypothetical protein